MLNWTPPADWLQITAIDAHTGGEPLRVITSGFPDIPGKTILEKRHYAVTHYDHLRKALMWEPRGHADMYGCLLTSPVTSDGDVGVLFMHNEGFSTMCGHGIIGLVKVGIETGEFPITGEKTIIKIDTPAGRVTATAHIRDNKVQQVSFVNVLSFLLASDCSVTVEGLGDVSYDLAYGGAFYAYVDADAIGIEISRSNVNHLIDAGKRIKHAVMTSHDFQHPNGDEDLNFLYGTIFVQLLDGDVHSRNVCIFADGEVDRSPTGTGVSGRLAIHHAKGELPIGETILIESIIGSQFAGRVLKTTTINQQSAILPEVTGTAYITGINRLLIDPEDPLAHGFLLR